MPGPSGCGGTALANAVAAVVAVAYAASRGCTSQRGVGGDAAATVDNLAHACDRYPQITSQPVSFVMTLQVSDDSVAHYFKRGHQSPVV